MTSKKIDILGSTGSIGTQALEVISEHPGRFSLGLLTAGHNAELLIQQAARHRPEKVVIGNTALLEKVRSELVPLGIQVYGGFDVIADIVAETDSETVLTALVGYSGLQPTLRAIGAGKQIALANKETLVVAGDLVTRKAKEMSAAIYPVDSEHSAIFQCLTGEESNPVEKIILTASGGPFRGKDPEYLATVTRAQALKHPNWTMGHKITIDSATLMNKGLEVIEARWLFNLRPDQIDVVVHPQSIIHSMVQFEDGSIKAQMGLPDMRLPIQFALYYPQRLASRFPRFEFSRYPALTFEAPDTRTFRNLALAYQALERGGNLPCILNAANEIAVEAFLKEELSFTGIPELTEYCMDRIPYIAHPAFEDYAATDEETRRIARQRVKTH